MLKKQTRFRGHWDKVSILLFALVFGGAGAYIIHSTFAATVPTNCFAVPSSCGYPDATNTGPTGTLVSATTASLPAGAAWDSSSKVLRITGDNVTLSNLDIPGPVTVDGNHFTLNNSKITLSEGCGTAASTSNCGSYGMRLGTSDAIVTGTTLNYVSITTKEANASNDDPFNPDTFDVKVDHGVRNNGDQQATATGLYIKGPSGAWKGVGTIRDSYMYVQLVFRGDHVENILNGGEGDVLTIDHNTILNPLAQTAVISLFDDFGKIKQVTVTNNLLAGGGYVMYGGAKNSQAGVTGPVLVKDNRFARGNMDSHGYYPNGGSFGLFAEFNDSVTQSCGNFWDNDLSAITGPGSQCTSTGPPPVTPPSSGCTTDVSTVAAIQTAVSSAANGDVICVASGSYGAMTLSGGTGRTSKAILKPASGATVTFTGRAMIHTKHLEIQNMTFSQASSESYYIDNLADDIVMRDDTAKHFVVKATDDASAAPKNIQIIGGDVGGLAATSSDSGNIIGTNGGSTLSPSNVLIDGVNFHDMTVTSGSGFHMECLHVWAADGLTIRNSTFSHCSVFDIFVQRLDPAVSSSLPPAPQNITIENNFFNCCRHTGDTSDYKNFAIKFTSDYNPGTWNNITIRNNSADDKIQLDRASTVTYTNAKVYNNIAPALYFDDGGSLAKPGGVTADNNIWYSGSKVGVNDLNGQDPNGLFANFASLDFHLKAGSTAIDKASAANAPTSDIDGDIRPLGAAPDIGADETSASPGSTDTTAPTVSLTAPSTGATVSGTTVPVSATAADDTAVAGVQFRLDGNNLGTEDTASPYGTTWNTAGATNGTHTLTAVARDAAGNTKTSSSVTVTVNNASPDTTPPTKPAGLADSTNASLVTTATSITLTWTASTDDTAVASYKVYRGGTLIATVSGSTTSYTDYYLTANTAYSYTVVALDGSGNASTASAAKSITTSALVGDLDADAHVTGHDLSLLLSKYNTHYTRYEFDGYPLVQAHDLSLLLVNFGK